MKPMIRGEPRHAARRGRPSMGLEGKKFEMMLGATREGRMKRRAAFETDTAMRGGLRRTFISAAEIARKAIDLYLSLYPPPGETVEPRAVVSDPRFIVPRDTEALEGR